MFSFKRAGFAVLHFKWKSIRTFVSLECNKPVFDCKGVHAEPFPAWHTIFAKLCAIQICAKLNALPLFDADSTFALFRQRTITTHMLVRTDKKKGANKNWHWKRTIEADAIRKNWNKILGPWKLRGIALSWDMFSTTRFFMFFSLAGTSKLATPPVHDSVATF